MYLSHNPNCTVVGGSTGQLKLESELDLDLEELEELYPEEMDD